ncbi:MAG: subtilase family serine protease, partial [Cellvibrionaceae bacterium]
YCESPQQLRIIVRNQGDGPAGPTTTRVEHINQDFIEEQPTPALNAGEETVLTFPIPSACVSETCPFRITVNADPVDAVIESNTINNTDNSSCGIAS